MNRIISFLKAALETVPYLAVYAGLVALSTNVMYKAGIPWPWYDQIYHIYNLFIYPVPIALFFSPIYLVYFIIGKYRAKV